MNAAQFVKDAERFADISRAIIREEIYQPRDVTVKSDATPVTPLIRRLSVRFVKQ